METTAVRETGIEPRRPVRPRLGPEGSRRIAVALVPGPDLVDAAIAFQGRVAGILALHPVLDPVACLPHVSLLHATVRGDLDPAGLARDVARSCSAARSPYVLEPGPLELDPGGWLFVAIRRAPWLADLQDLVVAACLPFALSPGTPDIPDPPGTPATWASAGDPKIGGVERPGEPGTGGVERPGEPGTGGMERPGDPKSAAKQFDYRFVGKAFVPHVTVGHLDEPLEGATLGALREVWGTLAPPGGVPVAAVSVFVPGPDGERFRPLADVPLALGPATP